MKNNQLIINGELLLLCERLEMARFLHVYLQHLFRQGAVLPPLQLLNYHSLEQLPALSKQLMLIPGSDAVRRLIVFADAQNAIEERGNLITRVRRSAYFKKREHCAHFFFPGRPANRRWRQGYLEDLLLDTLRVDSSDGCEYHNLRNMAQEYLIGVQNCRRAYAWETAQESSNDASYKFTNFSKHLLHTYLAGTEKFVGCDIAEAARLGAFDLEHKLFAGLKRCLLAGNDEKV